MSRVHGMIAVAITWLILLEVVKSSNPLRLNPAAAEGDINDNVFLNQWAVHIIGGRDVADQVATDMDFVNMGQIGSLNDYYLLAKRRHPKRSRRSAKFHTESLAQDVRVRWAEQQSIKQRFKRDLIDKRDEEQAYREARQFDDDYWQRQWYLFDSRPTTVKTPKLDLHVVPVWAKNITGDGIVITVLDDGLEHNHTDLFQNYDPAASFDFNDDDDDPFPRYDSTNENKHGTRCAGEVAMMANNHKCGVGVAYNARIGGVRMLDGIVTDSLEAKAISFNIDHIDIYSASWGPSDDGTTLERPGKLASVAFEKGITKGRGGKGVIYVWASGNGGFKSDNCDCDGYTNSIYTLSVSSASEQRKSPWYAEHCSSTMATTYSSGTLSDHKITTTDLHDKCTSLHSGTSASAPLAAGIVALTLQVNRDLTWRDVQHLVAWTSEYAPLQDNPGWKMNAAGYWVNSRFGFGLLNAAAMVNAADPLRYKNVPPSRVCDAATAEQQLPQIMSNGQKIQLVLETTGCQGQDNEINHLEHVVLTLSMTYSRRGSLQIILISPAGTETELLTQRPRDQSEDGFDDWPFMSVHTWGEQPAGQWILVITDRQEGKDNSGIVMAARLTLHGTREAPDHVVRSGGRRQYNYDYNDVYNTRENHDYPSVNGELSSADEQTDADTAEVEQFPTSRVYNNDDDGYVISRGLADDSYQNDAILQDLIVDFVSSDDSREDAFI